MKETPISSTLLARLGDATRYVISGVTPASWFGPMQPQKPQAPDDVAGRRFDYPVGYNLNATTRASEPVTFDDLRALADSCDILRSVIETRKDQMEAQEWAVRVKQSRHGAKNTQPSDEQKRRIDAVTAFLEYPDGEHSYAQWLRQVLEDMFVIDAVAVYKRRNRAGQLCALEIIDGASISLLLGEDGRTPQSPDPAYQQILKGLPAVDYTRDELIYIKHNPRSHKIYGYSHVEQVLVTVNIMIRRALHQLEYYREGSQPDALIGLPKEWSQDQIHGFQKHFDTLLAGNLASRRHVRFMPGDFKYQETKAPPLKDAYDEFLARIICFVFSVSPEPFVGQVNRATAESSHARAIAEGLGPLQRYIGGLMNRIITQDLHCPDLEFAWQDTREQDPKDAAQIDVAYVNAGIMTADEVRDRMGLQALKKAPVNKLDVGVPVAGVPISPGMVSAAAGNDTALGDLDEEEEEGDASEGDELLSGGDDEFESQHPRWDAGSPDGVGGQFRPKEGEGDAGSGPNQPRSADNPGGYKDNDSITSDPIGGIVIPAAVAYGAAASGVASAAGNAVTFLGESAVAGASAISAAGGRAVDGIGEQVGQLWDGMKDIVDGEIEPATAEENQPSVAENSLDWKLGGYKSAERWQNQMTSRKWTDKEITDTIKNGEQYSTFNNINKNNPATRFENSETGKYLVRDNITKEIIQLGKKDLGLYQITRLNSSQPIV